MLSLDNVVLVCIIVFIARMIDTTFATLKTVFIVKSKSAFAVLFAFLEVLIWFIIVKEAMNAEVNLFLLALSYAAGYACGTLIGMYITDKYVITTVSVNIVVKQKGKIIRALTKNNFAVSVSKIKGKDLLSNKYMIFVATTNKRVNELKKIVLELDENAFIVVSENKAKVGGY